MGELRRVRVVAKRSSYDIHVRQNKTQRVIDLLDQKDVTVARMRRADEHHMRTVEEVQRALESLGLESSFTDRDVTGEITDCDLVITVGGDGTLLWVSHQVGDIPMVGVNSAPQDSVGFLCATRMGEVRAYLEAVLERRVPRVCVARMQVTIDGVVQHRRVLNDALFAHPIPAMTSRYLLEFRGISEEQKSSGLWIATAAGSTAAIRSAGGRALSLRSQKLQFVVREPYLPPETRYAYVKECFLPGESLTLRSKMREARVYIDGSRDALSLELGQAATFSLSDSPLTLLGVSPYATHDRKRAPSSAPPRPIDGAV